MGGGGGGGVAHVTTFSTFLEQKSGSIIIHEA